MISSIDVHLKALDVLDATMAKRPDGAALVAQLRPDLEVLDRDDLIRVAVAIGAEASAVTGRKERPALLRRLSHRRVQVMWAGS